MSNKESAKFPAPTILKPSNGLRWGIIGTGWITQMWTPTVLKNTNQKIIAVGSKDLNRAKEFAQNFGIERAFGSYQELVAQDDIDAIYVASLPGEHAEHAIMALNHGKHVLIEKPLTLKMEEAEEIFRVANEKKLMAMEAMWTKYLPHMDVARKLVKDGAIGEVVLASATFCQNNTKIERLWRFGAGSQLIDMGIYPITFLHQFLGKPSSIKATAIIREGINGLPPVDAEVQALFQYSLNEKIKNDSNKIEKQSNFVVSARTSMPTIASLSGEKGAITIGDPFFAPSSLTLHGNDLGDGGVTWRDSSGIEFHQGLYYQVDAFAQFVEEGLISSPIHGPSDTLENLATTFEIASQIGIAFQ
jgi:predicted dehydrogenase